MKPDYTVIAAPIPDLEQGIANLINEGAPKPDADGNVSAAEAHEYRASCLRTLLLAAAGLAVQAERLGLRFEEKDFVEHARADYRYVRALMRGEPMPPGARS